METDQAQAAELNAAGWKPHRSLPWLWVSPDGRYLTTDRALQEARGQRLTPPCRNKGRAGKENAPAPGQRGKG